jgi:anti-anti-sigma regulatory factor
MVLPFFGRKTPEGGKSDQGSRTGNGKPKGDLSTSMDFTHAGGDAGRSLAAAADKIQVQEVSHEDVAAIEEAAVLYANANDSGAKAVLEEAIRGPSKNSERLWQMVFDLYRLTGDKASFDTQGVVFAQLFEKSPPVWSVQDTIVAIPQGQASNTPAVNLAGSLGSNAAGQFDQLTRIATRTGKLRIDMSKLRGIDEAGCELLCDALEKLRRSQVKVAMLGVAHALTLLEPHLKVGEAQGRVFWIAALAMLQQLGDQDRFEDAAVNFAITFEESPPSWDPPEPSLSLTDTQDMQRIEEPLPAIDAPGDADAFVMDGIIAGPQPEVLRKLADYASERPFVEVDCSGLRRLEFVSAGSLFNQIAQFQSQGKRTLLRHPNEMVAALLVVMGIDQISKIIHKKF